MSQTTTLVHFLCIGQEQIEVNLYILTILEN